MVGCGQQRIRISSPHYTAPAPPIIYFPAHNDEKEGEEIMMIIVSWQYWQLNCDENHLLITMINILTRLFSSHWTELAMEAE